MKKFFVLLLVVSFALPSFGAEFAPSLLYPEREISGIVQWGQGGGTDLVMRPLAAIAEELLGKNIAVQNITGGAGSVAAKYVHDAPADGYTLLMGAENPAVYDVLGISSLTYDDFECVYLIGDGTLGVITGKNSPYKSLTELTEASKTKTLKMSTTGKGGLTWIAGVFLAEATGLKFETVDYETDTLARDAVKNGECDFTACKIQTGLEEWKEGNINFLCILSDKPVKFMPKVLAVTAEYPAMAKYFPWGSFYGVFVKKGTPAFVKEQLTEHFSEAGLEAGYQVLLNHFNINFMGTSGEEAAKYISSWREKTSAALKNSGALK